MEENQTVAPADAEATEEPSRDSAAVEPAIEDASSEAQPPEETPAAAAGEPVDAVGEPVTESGYPQPPSEETEPVIDPGLSAAETIESAEEPLEETPATESGEPMDAAEEPVTESGHSQPPSEETEPVIDPGLPAAETIESAEEPLEETPATEPGEPMDAAEESVTEYGDSQPPSEETEPVPADPESQPAEQMSADELLFAGADETPAIHAELEMKAVIEAIIYVTEEPMSLQQIATALQQPVEKVEQLLSELSADFEKPEHGIAIREVAGGYKMATKPEHHDAVRNFVKSLKPPLKLSLAALETLAVVAYKQPVTAPEIADIRGVQGTGVMKTLLDRKLIAAAGRKNVIGKPILYKTTKDFLVQFGLKDLTELPSLKEFEEIRRMALSDESAPEAEPESPPTEAAAQNADGPEPAPEAEEPKSPSTEAAAQDPDGPEPAPEGDPPPDQPPVEPPPEEAPINEPPPGEEPPQKAVEE